MFLSFSVCDSGFSHLRRFFNYAVFCFDSYNAISFVINFYNQNSLDRTKERMRVTKHNTYSKRKKAFVIGKYNIKYNIK